MTTLPAGEGAEGISVGDLLRFGAYAGAFPSPETFQERNGIDVMETRSNNTISVVLATRLLVEAFGLPAVLRAHIFLVVLEPLALRPHIYLTLCDRCARLGIAIAPNWLGRFQTWKSIKRCVTSFSLPAWKDGL